MFYYDKGNKFNWNQIKELGGFSGVQLYLFLTLALGPELKKGCRSCPDCSETKRQGHPGPL